jgi:hypothetical protein
MGDPQVFYGELAPWWPLISPLADYEEEAASFAGVLRAHTPAVHDVLELGSGGGHVAWYLKAEFAMTLTDLSAEMLEQSAAINGECVHVQGDMQTIRLDRTFDAVFVHDAIEYLLTEQELRAAFVTAFAHLRPGGLLLVVPDATTESFEPGEDVGGADEPGRSVRFLEWSYDPDPNDTWVQTEYVFALRVHGEPTHVRHETHRTGLFPRSTWERELDAAGFAVRWVREITEEDRPGRDFIVATRR